MTLFRRLAITSTAATFLLVTIGGLVRATKSGLGCGTNWPHCPGAINRALIIEFSHRATAGVVVILLGALAWLAFRHLRQVRALLWPSLAAFALVLFQAVLGAIVVWLELKAESVVLHLGTAMILLGLLVYITAAALVLEGRFNPESDPPTGRRSATAAGTVLLLLLVGSYVTGTGAGNVFPDWPLMDGRVVPDLAAHDQAAHFFHRALAAITGVILTIVAWRVLREKKRLRHQADFARAAVVLFAIEVMVGAANVWSDLDPWWVTSHLALAAAIWVSLVTVAVTSHPVLQSLSSTARVTTRRPALEAR